MPKYSSGILLYRRRDSQLDVLLVHPGGPFWSNKDDGAWSIPKGEHSEGDDSLKVALREFAEELGIPAPDVPWTDLGTVRQPGGKVIRCWMAQADFDVGPMHSNTFTLEWPPRSGQIREFPEVDRAQWFDLRSARRKLLAGQLPVIDRLVDAIGLPSPQDPSASQQTLF